MIGFDIFEFEVLTFMAQYRTYSAERNVISGAKLANFYVVKHLIFQGPVVIRMDRWGRERR